MEMEREREREGKDSVSVEAVVSQKGEVVEGWLDGTGGGGGAYAQLQHCHLSSSVATRFPDSADRQNMHMTAVWTAFILAQSSGLLVEGMRSHYDDPLSTAQIAEVDDNPADNREPTCEELRTMWKYTKRQSRATKVMNELPFIQDPFAYNAWKNYPARPPPLLEYQDHYSLRPRTRAAGSAPVYGRIVHKAPPGSRFRTGIPHRARSFEDVAHLYGTINFHPPSPRRRLTSFRIGGGASPPISQVPQAGSFQHIRDLIRNERARELRKQHAEENKTLVSAKATTIKEYPNINQDLYQNVRPRKHFANSLDEYQQFRNAKADISRAWSRGGRYLPEYMLR